MSEKRKLDIEVGVTGNSKAVDDFRRQGGKTIRDLEREAIESQKRIQEEQRKTAEKWSKMTATQRLKARFGEESTFGQTTAILRGAGPVAAIAGAAAVASNFGDQLTKINELQSSGKATQREINDEYMRMIPIIGNVAVALDEAFSGRRHSEAMRREVQAIVAEVENGTNRIRAMMRNDDRSGSVLGRVANRREQLGLDIADLDTEHLKAAQGKNRQQREELADAFYKRQQAMEAQAERDIQKIRDDAAKEAEQKLKDKNQRLLRLQEDFEIAKLRAAGKTREADLLSKEFDWDRRINGAQTEEEKRALRQQKTFDLRTQRIGNATEDLSKSIGGSVAGLATGAAGNASAIQFIAAEALKQAEDSAALTKNTWLAGSVAADIGRDLVAGIATPEAATAAKLATSAGLRESRFLTGVGGMTPEAKATIDTAKSTKAMAADIKDIARAIKAGGKIKVF